MKIDLFVRVIVVLVACGGLSNGQAVAQQATVEASVTDQRDANETESIRVVRDVSYKPDAETAYEHERCKLDWYLPAGVKDFPTLVWFHGGSLQGGHKGGDIAVPLARHFASEGIAVVSVNYRLSPRVHYPAYVQDAAVAVAYVCDHVAEYGGAADQVFVSGHSAGGYLTAMVGLHPDIQREAGLSPESLAGLIPVSGQMVTHSTVRGERSIPPTRPIIDDAAPLYHVSPKAPPFLCIAGSEDLPARSEESRYFVAAMKATGHGSTEFMEFAGRDHGTIASRMGESDDAVAHAVINFIRRHAK